MISIIIPAYNAAQTLPACLAALQRQTQPPDEIIVVDDGSQDQTAQVARAYGAQLLEQPHQGPAAARNLGMHQALTTDQIEQVAHACTEILGKK
jgi:glycosyltransferase involved in cell wall biosynthesis